MIYFTEFDEIDPLRIQWSSIKYHRNNATYKMLVNICYLIIKGMLLTEQRGSKKIAHYLDDQLMHSLYEKFVLKYYRRHYPQFHASAAHIDWDVDDGIVEFLTFPQKTKPQEVRLFFSNKKSRRMVHEKIAVYRRTDHWDSQCA